MSTLTQQSPTVIPTYKKIWYVSLPIMLTMFAQNIITATDTAFMGRVGEIEQGAVALGGIYYYVLFMIGFGFATGMQILISRRNGEGNYTKIGSLFENGTFFLIALSVFLIAISLIYTPRVLNSIIKYDTTRQAVSDFLNIRIYGLVFEFIAVAYRGFHVGTTNTRPLTYSAIIMAVSNIILNYILVFGNFGFPAMGIKGAAIGSVVAEFIAVAFLTAYNSRTHIRKKYNLFYFAPINFKLLKRMLDVSIFVMLQYFLSLSTWLAFFIMIEKTGEENLASSNVVRTLYGFIGIPFWAFAAASSSFVSNAMGAGYVKAVPYVIKRVLKLGVISAVILIPLVLLFARPLMYIFTTNSHIVESSLSSLYVVLGANIVFTVGVILFNSLSGTGKTKMAMIVEIVSLVFYVTGLYLLTNHFSERIQFIWFSEFIYWGMLTIFTLLYFKFGNWKNANI